MAKGKSANPSWKETRQTTILVMICVVLFGIFFFAVDFLIGIVVPFVLNYGSPS
jgi:preprotein translocase SecE subunit